MPSAHNRSIGPSTSSFFHSHHPARSLASSPSPASSAPTSPAHVDTRRRESKDASKHRDTSKPQDTQSTQPDPTYPPHQMSAPKTSHAPHFTPPRSRANARRIGIRRKDDVRPERKASVRKQVYDLGDDDDDDDLDLDDDDDQDDFDISGILDDSDLSDVPPADDGNSSIHLDSDSDSDMAAKLQAAGDGESLLGSGESGDEQEDDEERFIIADATMADNKAAAQRARTAEQARRRAHALRSRQRRRPEDQGADGDIEDAADAGPEDDLGSLSPDTMRLLGLPVLEDELFQEQEGFHSDSEPSFSDFFGSDGGGDQHDDDDELTSFDTSDEDDDISDLDDAALVGEPLIAHVGAASAADSSAQQQQQQQNATSAQDLQLAMEAGAEIARQDIPLLVIEDLDGRLIYARAGDGEAVFGSDGEFEFVESDEDEDTDDDFFSGGGLHARGPQSWANAWPSQEDGDGGLGAGDGDVFDDEGDTTDELPDEDMPFPRLLVGSVDPRGGRTSRRARAMAAQMRRLSPNVASKRGHMRTDSAQTDDAMSSITSPRTPTADMDAPLPATPAPAQQGQAHEAGDATGASMGPPSSSSAAPASSEQSVEQQAATASTSQSAVAGPSTTPFGAAPGDASAMSQLSQLPQGINGATSGTLPATPALKDRASMGGWLADVEGPRPEMGSFMPSSSKSVHRAVIDGSRQAASPFTSKYSLQRRGLAGRRRPRRSSFSSSQGAKRARRGSLPSVFTGEDFSEAASSPEALKTAAPLPMELDDVVDASMLWRSDSSSDSEGQDSDASGGTAVPRRRSRSKTTQSSSTTDGFGLNSNAFSRWRKIPMGAFREQQQGVLQGGGAAAAAAASSSRHPGGGAGHQGFGNYLLTRVSHSSQRRIEHSPFRRTGSHHGGSLHMMVPSAHTPHHHSSSVNGGAGRRASLIVSPVLWPVHGRNRGGMGGIEDHETASSRASPLPHRGAGGTESATGSRKMTKREKRERKAQRAAMRAAARAEKERLRAEAMGLGQVEEGVAEGGAAAAGGNMAATAPSTPNVGPSPAAADVMSPSNAMPRLSITEASPRASPAPPTSRDAPGPSQLRSVAAGADSAGGESEASNSPAVGSTDGTQPPPPSHSHSPSQSLHPQGPASSGSLGLHAPPPLPGNTPPTRAVAASDVGVHGGDVAGEHVPSLPSSTFGPPLASPLFGGLFAPLSMGGGGAGEREDELEELELERDGETVLQI